MEEVHLESPKFLPSPGRFGKVLNWSARNRRSLLVVAALVLVVAAITLFFSRDAVVTQATPTPSASPAFSEKAEAGQGVTHLARSMFYEYLVYHSDIQLSPAQEMYAVTLLANKYPHKNLNVGDEISYTNADMAQAVTAAQSMTPYQIHYFSQFTQ